MLAIWNLKASFTYQFAHIFNDCGRFPSGRAIRYIFLPLQDKKDAAAIPNATFNHGLNFLLVTNFKSLQL